MRDGLHGSVRQSMAWLHTWAGLVVGWLLFAIFLTGALSFYQDEISVWMKPELHRSTPDEHSAQRALDRMALLAPGASNWNITLPSERDNSMPVSWRMPGAAQGRQGTERAVLDAGSGEVLEPRDTRGGGFLYRFHFELYGMQRGWARWIVGIATLVMLVGIISGVVTHKKIFKDFFTFRPGKGQRSWLDAHNASAVLALPFHFMITYSGLLLLMNTLMPWATELAYQGDQRAYLSELRGRPVQQPPQPRPAAADGETTGSQTNRRASHDETGPQNTRGGSNAEARREIGDERRPGAGGDIGGNVGGTESARAISDGGRGNNGIGSARTPLGERSGERGAARDGERGGNTGGVGLGADRDNRTRNRAAAGRTPEQATVPLVAIASLIEQARQQWQGQAVGNISVSAPMTSRAVIELRSLHGTSLLNRGATQRLRFNGATGELLETEAAPAPSLVRGIYNGFSSLHMLRFADGGLRALFFCAGLIGTAMVATGLLLWVSKRSVRPDRRHAGHRLVEMLNVAAIAGLPIAIAAYFWANRLIPAELEDARAAAEIRVFFIAWTLALTHAALRPYKRAWIEQLALGAALFLLLPWLDALGGTRNLFADALSGRWITASVDLVLLTLGAWLAYAGWRVWRHRPAVKAGKQRTAKPRATTRPATPPETGNDNGGATPLEALPRVGEAT